MAWEWSHSAEAYAHAREQVQVQSREWLETVFAEWTEHKGKRRASTLDWNQKKYDFGLARAKTLPGDTLADFIWEKMEELATCTNGGWQAYCCPHGCMGHMVPFGPEENGD